MSRYDGDVERRILRATKFLFAEKGHEETRLREIAASAHTSESQIIKYFESKAGLLEALISEAQSRIDVSFDTAQKDTADPILLLEFLPSLLLDLLDLETELIKVYLFCSRYYALTSEKQLLPEAQFRAQLSAIFERGQKSKVFRNDFDTHVAASALWGASLGLLRDKLHAVRNSNFPDYTRKEITTIISAMVASFMKT